MTPNRTKATAIFAEITVAAADDVAGCTEVDEPMLDIPTSDTEPRIRIPQDDNARHRVRTACRNSHLRR